MHHSFLHGYTPPSLAKDLCRNGRNIPNYPLPSIVGTSGGTQQFAKIRVLKMNYFPFPGSNLLQIMNKFSCTKFFHIIYFNLQQKNLQINFFIEMPPDVILLIEIQWSATFIFQKSQAKLTLLRYPATAPTLHSTHIRSRKLLAPVVYFADLV